RIETHAVIIPQVFAGWHDHVWRDGKWPCWRVEFAVILKRVEIAADRVEVREQLPLGALLATTDAVHLRIRAVPEELLDPVPRIAPGPRRVVELGEILPGSRPRQEAKRGIQSGAKHVHVGAQYPQVVRIIDAGAVARAAARRHIARGARTPRGQVEVLVAHEG